MRKNFGAKTWVYPMPVFIIAAYDENDKANAMNATWGGISEENQISICISVDHKTTLNIQASSTFTVSMATAYDPDTCILTGKIVNTSADESVLDENGKISFEKLNPITYDPVYHTYRKLGEVVGFAFKDGLKLK